jgi:hypothetical protein
MAAELLPMLARAGDTNNNPMSGAKWYFYETGTTTPQSVYTTSALSVAHANPVVADGAGKFSPIYFNATLTYRGVLKSSDDATTIFDFDPINPTILAALGAPTGSSLVNYLGSGASASARPVETVLRERISAKDNSATGDGATNDYTNLASALTDYAAREVRFPAGSFKTLTALVPLADTVIVGEGPASIVKTTAASNHVFNITEADIAINDLAIQGVNGSDVLNNSAVKVLSVARARLERIEASGMSGSAFYLTGGSSYGYLSQLYVHGMVGTLANASDVMLYNDAHKHTVTSSILTSGRTVGVYCQLNSTGHKITFNYIDGQTIYGVLDYDTTPRNTYSLILGNSVSNISGSEEPAPAAGPVGGAGIYTADTGGQIITANHVTNTNTDTTTELLIPAGIGINGTNSLAPLLVGGNVVHHCDWYGVMVGFNDHPSPVIGNIIFENDKDQLYFKDSHGAIAIGNSISALLGTADQARCINVNVSSTGKTGALLLGNRTQGGLSVGIDARQTSQSLFVANNISDTAGRGLQLIEAADLVVSGNMIDVSDGTDIALNLDDVTYSSFSNMVLKIGGGATIALNIDGTCTGTRFDKSVIVSGKTNPMDFIDNNAAGCIVEQWGTGAPTLLTHQVGDTVWNSAPAVGQPIGWKCSTAGSPGTWTAMANL